MNLTTSLRRLIATAGVLLALIAPAVPAHAATIGVEPSEPTTFMPCPPDGCDPATGGGFTGPTPPRLCRYCVPGLPCIAFPCAN